MSLLRALHIEDPSIVTVVGAGGKTSAIQTIANELITQRKSCLVTTTTRMLYSQLPNFPKVSLQQYDKGIHYVKKYLSAHQGCSWIAKWELEKAIGIRPEWIDAAYNDLEQKSFILVEGDGASSKLIKSPASHEPVVPSLTSYTIGVLNVNAVNRPLSAQLAHRIDLVTSIIGKQAGEIISPGDFTQLAISSEGIFSRTSGTRILLLSGATEDSIEAAEAIVENLATTNQSAISRCIITSGYGKHMTPIRVYNLK